MLAAHRVLHAPHVSASYDSVILADSPVGFWPLNESSGTTASDATGNGHNGTYTGGYTLGATGIGDGESAVALDGSSGYIIIPDAAALQITGDLSLEIWVDLSSYSNYWFLISKDLGSGSADNPYELRTENSSGVPNFLQCAGTGYSNVMGINPVGDTAFVHLVVTRQSSNGLVTHYLNGVSNGTGTIGANPPVDGNRPVYIGTRDDSYSYLNGTVAKAAIYNYALTSTQVSNHYAAA